MTFGIDVVVKKINLNADMGESFGTWKMGDDSSLLKVVCSANIACGFHAGDPLHIANTTALALEQGVSVGAHPSFSDLQGFGRRQMQLSPQEFIATVVYQIGALQAIAISQGAKLTHVKPHGAMSNMSCANLEMARQLASAVKLVDINLILLAPACSFLSKAGTDLGLSVALEIFADRAYQEDGQLVPRSMPNSMIHGPEASAQHVIRMLNAGGIISLSGSVLPTSIHSICVHGDNPQAVESAKAVKNILIQNGFTLATLTEMFI